MRKIMFSVLIFLSVFLLGSFSAVFGEMMTSTVGVAVAMFSATATPAISVQTIRLLFLPLHFPG
jgi:hypothetical protein